MCAYIIYTYILIYFKITYLYICVIYMCMYIYVLTITGCKHPELCPMIKQDCLRCPTVLILTQDPSLHVQPVSQRELHLISLTHPR